MNELTYMNELPNTQTPPRWVAAMVRLANDILSCNDRGKINALVLFDLSGPFNTIDHDISLPRLQTDMGSQVLLYHGLGLTSLVAPRLFLLQGTLHRLVLSPVASHRDCFKASSFLHLHPAS